MRRSSGEPVHAAGAYRALTAGTVGRRGLLGRRWRVAVGMEELGASWRLQWRAAGLRELGGCSCEEEGRPEAKWELGRGRADAGDVKARSGAAWPARSGQRRRAAVAGDTRRADSAVGRPLNARFSFVRTRWPSLTARFQLDLPANPWLLRANAQHEFCSPRYQLQLLFNDRALIRIVHRVKS